MEEEEGDGCDETFTTAPKELLPVLNVLDINKRNYSAKKD